MASVAGKRAPNQLVFRLKEKGLTWCQIRDRLQNASEPSSPLLLLALLLNDLQNSQPDVRSCHRCGNFLAAPDAKLRMLSGLVVGTFLLQIVS
jgi:hypothetical protein